MANPPTFDASASQFSIDNCYFMAIAAQAAYTKPDPAATLASAAFPWDPLTTPPAIFSDGAPDNDGTAIRGFVASTADAVVLAFRGTSNLPGWMTDFNIVQVDDPDTAPNSLGIARVHLGFENGLNSVWNQVLNLVTAQLTGGRKLWITGHSLGGGLATLAANRFCSMPGINVSGLYTFGSPKVGNESYFRGYMPIHFRCVNNDDIVPHVPMHDVFVPVQGSATGLAGILHDPFHALPLLRHYTYVHVGSLKYFDRHKHLGDGTSDQETKEQQMLDLLAKLGEPPQSAITDHFIANYVAAVMNNL